MKPSVLITGGAGFIGTNTARHFLSQGWQTTILDNLNRPGVKLNLKLLQADYPKLKALITDVQDIPSYLAQLTQSDVIIHLAGQTAVTISISQPQFDFDNNLRASLLLLEAVRLHHPQAICLFASTNKVYGDLNHHQYQKNKKTQAYQDLTAPKGINESEPLSFLSPYGCSKGAADQYFLDYAHTYGLKTVVFRQSCIYGEYQHGVEDQGWVAHFAKLALTHTPITIFGDGYQVRDLLYVNDLVKAYDFAIQNINQVKGLALNIGGGVSQAFSLLQVIRLLENKLGHQAQLNFKPPRLGDQNSFISANQLIKQKLKWQPETDFKVGLNQLISWQKQHLLSRL